MPGMENNIPATLKKARKERGLTLQQVADAIGVTYPAVQQWEAGRTLPTTENLMKLQQLLNADLVEGMVFEVAPKNGSRSRLGKHAGESINVGRMYVRWVAEAGNWREHEQFFDEGEAESFIVPQIRNDGLRRFLTRIAGDSMDKARLFDGDYVVTIDWNDIDRPANDGEIVVVQQTRDGGHTIETTVKQIRVHRDRYELHPRSTNPRHKTIVVKHGDGEHDGREVTIIGLVESVYRPILGRAIE